MNAKTENKPLSLDEQIAALLALKERREAVAGLVGEELDNIRKLDAAAIDSKNAADQANGQRGSIWDNMRSIMFKVYDATADAPDTRHQVFTDVLDEFLNPKGGDAADKVKLTTAGQYASTARKYLTTIMSPEAGTTPVDVPELSVKDAREAFKDAGHKARVTAQAEPLKQLRYAAKHGTDAEYAEQVKAVFAAIEGLYNPIRARKDKASKKAEADREIRDLVQQQPAAPAVVEIVAADIAGDDGEEVQKQQAV